MPKVSTSDAGKIAVALGLFASCIKSGEDWSETCEQVHREAHEALVRICGGENPLPRVESIAQVPTK